MKDQQLILTEQIETMFRELQPTLIELRRALQANEVVDLETLASFLIDVRRAFKFLEDLSKDVRKVQQTLERIICLLWAQGDGKAIRCAKGTVSPTVKLAVNLPSRTSDPARYAALMEYLGAPDSNNFRPHWPGITEMITQKFQDGEPLPPGFEAKDVYQVFGCTVRRKAQQIGDDEQ